MFNSHKKWINVSHEQIAYLQHEMSLHTRRVLFVAKLTHSLIIPALIATGLAHIAWRRWFGALLTAEFIWTGSLVLLGYYLGRSLTQLEVGLQYLTLAGVAIILLMLGRRLWRQQS